MAMELDEICRTCLQRGRPVQPLFDENGESFAAVGMPLVDFVNMFTEIMILRTDGFPEQICTACINEAKRAYAFKLRCECSETILYRVKENYGVINLDNISNFNLMCFKTDDQPMTDESMNDVNNDSFVEITNSVMDLLQIETTEDDDEDNCVAKVDSTIDEQSYMKHRLTEMPCNGGIRQETEESPEDAIMESFLVCSACPEVFRSRELLKSHVIDYHTDGKTCILCNQEFDCIQSHTETHLQPRLQCSHCDQKFEYRPLLNAHLRTHMVKNEKTGRFEFQCEICPRAFASHFEFMSHKRVHTEDRPFTCETCGMAFKRRDKLKAHMTSHSDERPFQCTLCESRFKRKDNLNSHMKSVHQQLDKIFKCGMCEKGFRFKDKLKAHMNTHLRLFSCQFCHIGFTRKDSLDKHVEQKHTSNNSTSSNSSSSSSSTNNVEANNANCEEEFKPYQCSVCKKEFILQDALNSHMKTHVKKVELKCDLCLKVFSQSNKLKSHMITHTDHRPFQCLFCPSLFKRKDNLNRHMKKHSRSKAGRGKSQSENLESDDRNSSRETNGNCDSELNETVQSNQSTECSLANDATP